MDTWKNFESHPFTDDNSVLPTKSLTCMQCQSATMDVQYAPSINVIIISCSNCHHIHLLVSGIIEPDNTLITAFYRSQN